MYKGKLIVDLFAGGGGASLGIEMALGVSPDIAVNPDPEAVALHRANHPFTKHFIEDVYEVDPYDVCGGKHVGLLWMSPDCKHFSKAKGGKPLSCNIRSLAWVGIRWEKAVKPDIIILENAKSKDHWQATHIAQHNLGNVGRKITKPLSTITQTGSQQQIVTSHLLKNRANF